VPAHYAWALAITEKALEGTAQKPGVRTRRVACADNRSHVVTSEPLSNLALGFALRLRHPSSGVV
jgi:hypothetical protein